MRTSRRPRRGRAVGPLIAAAALAVTVYAIAASNTVPATRAGDGSQAISGYTISSVAYGLNSSNPANIDSVTFTIAPTSATTVKTSLNGGTTWYSCTNSSGSVSCTTTSPQATVAGATTLQVVATG
jgi:hypothetical protein